MSEHSPNEVPTWLAAPNYPADLFAGTAPYYARYRLPYPQALIDDLRKRAGITGSGLLLDLACGPGRLTLPMAPFFREVWAVDLEPEMIEVGQEEARQRGVTNIRWMVGRAEEVEAPPNSFELITIGEAFHRLDQRRIAKRALEWLSPGRCLAVLWYENVGKGNEQWQSIAHEVIQRWVRQESSARSGTTSQQNPNFEEVLQATGFIDVATRWFSMPYLWTLDALIGYCYSGSRTSKRALGDRAEAFEADLRQTLLAYDPKGVYPETAKFGYILARRPA
jgi:SAM-dependent methyltransferase